MQIDPCLRTHASLHRLFIENVDDRRVVMLSEDDRLHTCNPLASLLRMEQTYRASRYVSILLNSARDTNNKQWVEIGPAVTVREWNLIIASALTEQIETRRFLP
jgi:hypothetical protein